MRPLIAVLLTLLAAGASQTTSPVAVDFQAINFHVAPGVVLEVRRLQGALISRRANAPPNLDDVTSYELRIDAGEIAMSPASLTNLLNQRVFTAGGPPIRHATITIEDGLVKQQGKLQKGVQVPFTVVGNVSATPDGKIRVTPESVKTAGVPAKGVLKLLHIELDNLIPSAPSRGFATEGNDIVLDPATLLPDPRISGQLTAVRIEPTRIVQTFGRSAAHGPERRGNYMHYRGNRLKFGRLTMENTDLLLIDADPKDAFEFSPGAHQKQLAAGYSKTLLDGSLRVYMPDLDAAESGAPRKQSGER
ncbi:MAG TPA: hypothetical protein VL173_10725 [Vicinamibacterales bacterium]|nr:hypothetical protein [Vicinamibacterales bacterium]